MTNPPQMKTGKDGAVDHHGEVLPTLSKRSADLKYEELLNLPPPKFKGKYPGSSFFMSFGYFCLNRTKETQFRNLIVSGKEKIPSERGTLCTAWHTNGVMDPLLVILTHPKKAIVGARHDLVLRPILGWWARKFAVQPVIRKAELIRGGCSEEAAAFLNGRSLRALADGISTGYASALFPEGTSHNEAHLLRIRTGPMRTIIAAAALSDIKERPRPVLQPLGLHFRIRHHWRTDCWVEYGDPLIIPENAVSKELKQELEKGGWKEPDFESVCALRDRLEEKLIPLTPNAPDWSTNRTWHLLGHLRNRAIGKTPNDWREEVLAARKERDRTPIEGDELLIKKADSAAVILHKNNLDGRDLAISGELRKANPLVGIARIPILLLSLLTLPIFIMSCGVQTILGYKIGNKTDEGLDARTSFQFMVAMFVSLLLWPLIALGIIISIPFISPEIASLFPSFSYDGYIGWGLTILFGTIIIIVILWLVAWLNILMWDYLQDLLKAIRRRRLSRDSQGKELALLTTSILQEIKP
jgi:1-acyl-sn-glycerol-3-phosphate acyltransferase